MKPKKVFFQEDGPASSFLLKGTFNTKRTHKETEHWHQIVWSTVYASRHFLGKSEVVQNRCPQCGVGCLLIICSSVVVRKYSSCIGFDAI